MALHQETNKAEFNEQSKSFMEQLEELRKRNQKAEEENTSPKQQRYAAQPTILEQLLAFQEKRQANRNSTLLHPFYRAPSVDGSSCFSADLCERVVYDLPETAEDILTNLGFSSNTEPDIPDRFCDSLVRLCFSMKPWELQRLDARVLHMLNATNDVGDGLSARKDIKDVVNRITNEENTISPAMKTVKRLYGSKYRKLLRACTVLSLYNDVRKKRAAANESKDITRDLATGLLRRAMRRKLAKASSFTAEQQLPTNQTSDSSAAEEQQKMDLDADIHKTPTKQIETIENTKEKELNQCEMEDQTNTPLLINFSPIKDFEQQEITMSVSENLNDEKVSQNALQTQETLNDSEALAVSPPSPSLLLLTPEMSSINQTISSYTPCRPPRQRSPRHQLTCPFSPIHTKKTPKITPRRAKSPSTPASPLIVFDSPANKNSLLSSPKQLLVDESENYHLPQFTQNDTSSGFHIMVSPGDDEDILSVTVEQETPASPLSELAESHSDSFGEATSISNQTEKYMSISTNEAEDPRKRRHSGIEVDKLVKTFDTTRRNSLPAMGISSLCDSSRIQRLSTGNTDLISSLSTETIPTILITSCGASQEDEGSLNVKFDHQSLISNGVSLAEVQRNEVSNETENERDRFSENLMNPVTEQVQYADSLTLKELPEREDNTSLGRFPSLDKFGNPLTSINVAKFTSFDTVPNPGPINEITDKLNVKENEISDEQTQGIKKIGIVRYEENERIQSQPVETVKVGARGANTEVTKPSASENCLKTDEIKITKTAENLLMKEITEVRERKCSERLPCNVSETVNTSTLLHPKDPSVLESPKWSSFPGKINSKTKKVENNVEFNFRNKKVYVNDKKSSPINRIRFTKRQEKNWSLERWKEHFHDYRFHEIMRNRIHIHTVVHALECPPGVTAQPRNSITWQTATLQFPKSTMTVDMNIPVTDDEEEDLITYITSCYIIELDRTIQTKSNDAITPLGCLTSSVERIRELETALNELQQEKQRLQQKLHIRAEIEEAREQEVARLEQQVEDLRSLNTRLKEERDEGVRDQMELLKAEEEAAREIRHTNKLLEDKDNYIAFLEDKVNCLEKEMEKNPKSERDDNPIDDLRNLESNYEKQDDYKTGEIHQLKQQLEDNKETQRILADKYKTDCASRDQYIKDAVQCLECLISVCEPNQTNKQQFPLDEPTNETNLIKLRQLSEDSVAKVQNLTKQLQEIKKVQELRMSKEIESKKAWTNEIEVALLEKFTSKMEDEIDKQTKEYLRQIELLELENQQQQKQIETLEAEVQQRQAEQASVQTSDQIKTYQTLLNQKMIEFSTLQKAMAKQTKELIQMEEAYFRLQEHLFPSRSSICKSSELQDFDIMV